MFKLLSKKPEILRILRGPFKGAKMFLNPAHSKRMVFGLYEYSLNDWLKVVPPTKDFAFDIGANTGYDTYGLAHLLSHSNTRGVDIVAFEPEADRYPELTTPQNWAEYSRSKIEIISKFAGAEDDKSTVTIDTIYNERPDLEGKKGLMKIDVEGAECEVLKGAKNLLQNPDHDWMIEIHGKSLIPKVAKVFCELDRPFLIRNLPPVPFLGKEKRSLYCYWLITLGKQFQ
ncbi:MAG: FkbM family methyltransferase [Opitutae bacterium]|nr:FkbM family methyltransferase [Opitutae bacterium]MBT5692926.1 FkbM family methyltransferase [Opitutae bacterium]